MYTHSSLNGKPKRMNLFLFPPVRHKLDPKSPRETQPRNTWHGQFVSARVQSVHTKTRAHTHTQMSGFDKAGSPAIKELCSLLLFTALFLMFFPQRAAWHGPLLVAF